MIKEYYGFIKKYLEVAKPKKSYLILMMVTAFLYKGFYLLIPFYSSLIIKYITQTDVHLAFIMVFNLAVGYFGYRFFWFFSNKVYARNMNYTYNKMMKKILNKISTDIDDNFEKKISKGKLLNSINGDTIDIGDGIDQLSELIFSLVNIFILLLIVAYFNIYISFLLLVYIVIYIKLRNYYNKNEAIYYNKNIKTADQLNSLFNGMLSGMQEIKNFNMMPKLREKVDILNKNFSKHYLKKREYIILKNNDIRFLTYFVYIILFIIVLFLIKTDIVGIEFLVLVIGYMSSLIELGNDLIDASSNIREIDISVKRIKSILEYKTTKNNEFGEYDNDTIEGQIIFKGVNFSYNKEKIFDNLNLSIKPNELTMIVGHSGCGKSSLVNLLLRLYKIDSGEITIDGTNINEFNKKVYSSNVSIVNQKPFLFNMSIRENLNFVDKNINIQIEACKKVGIHDFIMSLPKKYNAVLREDANNISGGQKQLLSLARTLLSKAEVLIFDEVTSSLDPDSTNHIMKVIKSLKKDHTIIMITHKPKLMEQADRIIILNKGEIVGDGTHAHLIKNNEEYKWLQARKSASKLGEYYE